MSGFAGWALLEIFGFRKLPGFVEEVELAGEKMLRIRVPRVVAVTRHLDLSRPTLEQFYGGKAVFSLSPTTEAAVAEMVLREVQYLPALPPPGSSEPEKIAPLGMREWECGDHALWRDTNGPEIEVVICRKGEEPGTWNVERPDSQGTDDEVFTVRGSDLRARPEDIDLDSSTGGPDDGAGDVAPFEEASGEGTSDQEFERVGSPARFGVGEPS